MSAKTILLVDDDETVRDLAGSLIRGNGYEVLSASCGQDAVDVAERGSQVDLILLDLLMPEMDGFKTLEALRGAGWTDVPVVFLTAKDDDDDLLKGYEAGADFYLTKPINPVTLRHTIDYLIGDVTPAERQRLELLI